MQLFEHKNYQVVIAPIAFTITAFAKLRDKLNDPDQTLKELSFMWFFCDVRSDFQAVVDEKERAYQIKLQIDLPDDWVISDELKECIKVYREHSKTASSGLYMASVAAADYIEKQLSNPSELLAKKDAKGNPVYRITDITRLLKDTPDIMKKLHEARQQVIKEEEAQSELKGNKAKAMFEDDIF